MGVVHLLLIIIIIICCCYKWLSVTAQLDPHWKSATATSSKDIDASIITEGACGFGDLHKTRYGKYSAGLSGMLFNRGSSCGACFEVRCVDHVRWCLQGSPSVVLTATDFCPPNYGLPADNGGWCNFPGPTSRVRCDRKGGIRFTVKGRAYFMQVLIANVGLDGEVAAVKVKGSRTGWIPMGRNWGQNWQCNINLAGQPLSFELTTATTKTTLASYNVAPPNWKFGQTFPGKQF